MDTFIAAQVKGVKRTPNVRMPRPAQCLIVSRLAPRSLAATAGVAQKDFLVSLDGQPAAELAPETYVYRATEHRWTFYSRARHELIEIHATGIEPGVELHPTLDGIKERYDPRTSSPTELERVFEARDWAALERLAAATLAARPHDRDTPALAFLGAAQYETGRKAEGLTLIQEYVTRYASHWTRNFSGIALYYVALGTLVRGDENAGAQVLRSAFEHNRCPRFAEALEKYTGTRPPLEEPLWLGRTFPQDYRLPPLGAPGQLVGLDPTLAGLGPGELFAVCLLDGYRGNGPYNSFMLRYHNFAIWFALFLRGLHVITMEPERSADRAHYFRGEDMVQAAGLPLELLLEDGSLSASVGQSSSPFILLLDRERRVRYEGELESVDLWDTLAAVRGEERA